MNYLINCWKEEQDLHKVVPGGFNRFQGLPPHRHPRAQDRSVWKQVLELNWIWIFTKYYSKFEFDTSFLTIDIVRLWCSVSLASRRVLLSWKLERVWVSIQQLMSGDKRFKLSSTIPERAKNRFLKATSRVPIALFFCRLRSRFWADFNSDIERKKIVHC